MEAVAESTAISTDPYLLAKANAVLDAYKRHYAQFLNDIDIIAVEDEYAFELVNPETSGASRTFQLAGKIDARIQREGRSTQTVVEHKTTTDSLDPDSDYWDRLAMDSQVSGYYLAASVIGAPVENVLYDVILRPAQRPGTIPLLDDEGKKTLRDAEGNVVTNKDGSKRQSPQAGCAFDSRPETPEEFGARIAAIIAENPSRFFAQREIARLDSEVIAYMRDSWALSQEILYRRRMNIWPRNPDACTQMGGCEFFALCSNRAEVDGIRYQVKTGPTHNELSSEIQDGLELLTTSRTKALRRCARLHQLRYEQHIVSTEQESEALSFGRLIHEGLEAIYKDAAQRNFISREQERSE